MEKNNSQAYLNEPSHHASHGSPSQLCLTLVSSFCLGRVLSVIYARLIAQKLALSLTDKVIAYGAVRAEQTRIAARNTSNTF